MATNFPSSLDTLTNPSGTDNVSTVDHAAQHANANDAIEALQAKVGADSSAVNTSHDYKLSGVGTGDKAVSLTGTETLTNKTINTASNTITIVEADISDLGTYYEAGGTDVAVADGGTGASTASGARTNLGVAIGSDVQAYDAQLATIAGLTPASSLIIGNGLGDWTTVTPANFITDNNILTTSNTKTVTNKTIDADNNTISNLAIGSEVSATLGADLQTNGNGLFFTGAIDTNIIRIPDNIDGNALEINDDTGGATLMRFKTANGFEEITLYSNTKLDGANFSFGSGASVSTILDEDNMVSNSATALATQQSIKAYVDSATGGGLSNVVEDTTPQLGGDLDLNGNNIDFPTTPNISDCLDEDNMASDSATALATQQSIKAYVDAQVASAGGTPTIDSHFMFEDITLYETATAVSGTVTSPSAAAGTPLVRCTTANSNGSKAVISGGGSSTSGSKANFWDKNPQFTGYWRNSTTSGQYVSWALCTSQNTGTIPASGGTATFAHMGFILDVASSVVQGFDCSNANGTTQTTTDSKASVTETNMNTFAVIMTSGTNIKFYVDGSLLATHTTNLPSGSASVGGFQAGVLNTAAGGGAHTHDFGSITVKHDAA